MFLSKFHESPRPHGQTPHTGFACPGIKETRSRRYIGLCLPSQACVQGSDSTRTSRITHPWVKGPRGGSNAHNLTVAHLLWLRPSCTRWLMIATSQKHHHQNGAGPILALGGASLVRPLRRTTNRPPPALFARHNGGLCPRAPRSDVHK